MTTDSIISDVYAVRTGGLGPWFIRLGARLRGLPADVNHVAVMHHWDDAGVPWGIEGRPGGVGWVDMRRHFRSPATVSNAAQPRTEEQRYLVAVALEKTLGTPYDWDAIFAAAMVSLGLPGLFAADWRGRGVPGQVVCSAVAAWAHEQVGLARPTPPKAARSVWPAHWSRFVRGGEWRA